MSVITNDKEVREFLERGVENIYPNKEFVESKLKKGKQLKIYFGIDPTGPTLHLGHAVLLKKLGELQKLGHKIILLIGDFTAMIGDPTDKLAARVQLGRKEVLKNAKLYKKQASVFLKFSGFNKTEIKYNSKWFSKMKFGEVLHLASKMTVEQMLKRDMFEARTKEGKPVYIHEFLYPLMQGYDSVVMGVDGEIGGNDQMFNMLTGRTLAKQINNKDKFVITTKLLEDKEGKKMGKTEGNMVAISDSPQEIFGKIMSWADGMIVSGFELCTHVSTNEIKKIKDELNNQTTNPRDVKMRLAYEVTALYHGKEKAEKAQQVFINTFQKKELPDKIEEIVIKKEKPLSEIFLENGLVKSKKEFQRLIREGAVKFDIGNKINDESYIVEKNNVFKIGKKRFIKINVK